MSRSGVWVIGALLVCLLVAQVEPALGQRYQLIDLGSLSTMSWAHGLDNQGRVVYSQELPSTGYPRDLWESYLWDNGAATNLGNLGWQETYARDINDLGQIVGHSYLTSDGPLHAFLWDSGVLRDIGTLGGDWSWAYAINNGGQVVGRSRTGPVGQAPCHAFLYEGGTMTDLNDLTQPGSEWTLEFAYDINERAQVACVGATQGSTWWQACLYDNGSITDLREPEWTNSVAAAINDAGQIAGWAQVATGTGQWDFVRYPVLWSGGEAINLGTLGGNLGEAEAINSLGHVVGRSCTAVGPDGRSGGMHAVLYEDGSLIDLNDYLPPGSDWVLEWATDINDLGQIVGRGRKFSDGLIHAFLLVPEPATLALLALGGLALVRRRK